MSRPVAGPTLAARRSAVTRLASRGHRPCRQRRPMRRAPPGGATAGQGMWQRAVSPPDRHTEHPQRSASSRPEHPAGAPPEPEQASRDQPPRGGGGRAHFLLPGQGFESARHGCARREGPGARKTVQDAPRDGFDEQILMAGRWRLRRPQGWPRPGWVRCDGSAAVRWPCQSSQANC